MQYFEHFFQTKQRSLECVEYACRSSSKYRYYLDICFSSFLVQSSVAKTLLDSELTWCFLRV